MDYIDLRSDTVTHPTPEMRKAMAEAIVGDDVYGDDPTVNRLQAMSAERLGKEASLFMASGTMSNLSALLTHCGRGDEAIMGTKSHTFLYEQGGCASLGGIMPHTIPNQLDGTLKLDDIANAVRPDDCHAPRTKLLCLENTQNACNGSAIPKDYMDAAANVARRYGLGVHVDGARIFNAAATLKVPVADLVEKADSVTFCLSKGLCAPVGAMLCGSKDFIKEAHRMRKVVGGGMRQAGVIAAAGIVALETMPQRLHEDHTHAWQLAEAFALFPGVAVGKVQSNIFYFTLKEDCPLTADAITEGLKAEGILLPHRGPYNFRVVTHYWISDEDVQKVIRVMQTLFAKGVKARSVCAGDRC